MRKYINILIGLLLLAAHARAVSAFPNMEFRTTSSYMSSARTNHQSQITNYQLARPSGSMTAISASNFAQLNGEGGACYRASEIHNPAIRRGGRDDEEGEGGTSGIGMTEFHSPVGNTPWGLILLLLFAYVIKKQYLCRRFGKDGLFRPVKYGSTRSGNVHGRRVAHRGRSRLG